MVKSETEPQLSARKITRELEGAVCALVRECVRADLRLRLVGARAASARPTVFVMRRMQSTLRTELDVSRQRGFIFMRRTAWTPLSVVVHIHIAPVLEPAPSERQEVMFRPPAFVRDSGQAGTVAVALLDQRVLRLRLKKGHVEGRLDAGRFRRVDKWPADWIIAVVDLLAAWPEDARTGRPRPYRPTASVAGPVHRSLGLVRRCFVAARQAANDLSAVPDLAETDARVRRIHEQFGASYRIERFGVHADAWFDHEGRLALEDAADRALKISFRSELVRRPHHDELEITALPPDIIREGRHHDRLYEAVLSDAGRFQSALKRAFGIFPKAMMTALLEDDATRRATTFVRLTRHDQSEDTNVALIHGSAGGLEVRFLFEFKVRGLMDMSVRPEAIIQGNVSLVAGWREGIKPRKPQHLARFEAYLARLVRTMIVWQQATARGA